MATKGVSIDINKPENYETRSGVQVKKIRCLDNTLLYPLEVTLESGSIKIYTMEGFLIANAIHDYDLQLKQQEIKKRKIVDFKVLQGYQTEKIISHSSIFCLTDDGKIYGLAFNGEQEEFKWKKLPEIPQD